MDIRFKEETMEEINKIFGEKDHFHGDFTLLIDHTLGGTNIYRRRGAVGNEYQICGVEQLGDMIAKLIKMRDAIEEVTGIKFDD